MNDKTASSGNTDQGSKNTEQGADTGNKSLSSLLDEYDKGSRADDSNGSESPGSKSPSEVESLRREIQALKTEAAERSYQTGIRGVIETLKGDLDVDDLVVEAWANKQASDEPRLQQLWEERDTRKREFSEAIAALKPDFQKYAQEKILARSKDGQGNKNGLVAAVRNARESDSADTGLDDVDWAGLSDQEFALKEAEVFRLARAGKLK